MAELNQAYLTIHTTSTQFKSHVSCPFKWYLQYTYYCWCHIFSSFFNFIISFCYPPWTFFIPFVLYDIFSPFFLLMQYTDFRDSRLNLLCEWHFFLNVTIKVDDDVYNYGDDDYVDNEIMTGMMKILMNDDHRRW